MTARFMVLSHVYGGNERDLDGLSDSTELWEIERKAVTLDVANEVTRPFRARGKRFCVIKDRGLEPVA